MNMTNSDELYKEAALLYEENEYIAARDIFRQAALLKQPSRDELYMLNHNEKSAWLAVLWELSELYPTSYHIQVASAVSAMRVGRDHIAIRKFSMILEKFELSELEELHTRLGRLEANSLYARRIYKPDLFISDVLNILKLGNKYKAKFQLAKMLSRIQEVLTIPTLEQLMQEFASDEILGQLLESKIDELRMIEHMQTE